VDLVSFGSALQRLTADEIRAIALDLEAAHSSAADDVAFTRALLVVDRLLRNRHRSSEAALAAFAVVTAVQAAAARDRVRLPDPDVTRVARAAAILARGLVVAPATESLRCLARGWHRLPCAADLVAA
jgi:hypothetical protein